jgi:threonine dehydrogenase-like Zn-dependent dehydrogenase
MRGQVEHRAEIVKSSSIAGGRAPSRACFDELVPDVLEGRIERGRVFDSVTTRDGVMDGYRAMDDRKQKKAMLKF